MVIKKKGTKQQALVSETELQSKIDAVINRGGAIAEHQEIPDKQEESEKEFRFTLRGPESLMRKIDENKKSRASRNQWILDAIEEKLERSDLLIKK